jgi:hypothetical protein
VLGVVVVVVRADNEWTAVESICLFRVFVNPDPTSREAGCGVKLIKHKPLSGIKTCLVMTCLHLFLCTCEYCCGLESLCAI